MQEGVSGPRRKGDTLTPISAQSIVLLLALSFAVSDINLSNTMRLRFQRVLGTVSCLLCWKQKVFQALKPVFRIQKAPDEKHKGKTAPCACSTGMSVVFQLP